MERWQRKVAVVTGASAGIGSAVCLALARAELTVIGLARRAELVDKLQSNVKGKGKIVGRKCDVSNCIEVAAAFTWIEENFGAVNVLINNAGVLHDGQITDVGNKPLPEESLLSIIDINVKGPIMCTKHAVSSMMRHGFEGHIITINSIAGHYIPSADNFNVYPSSKHAITAFVASLATELAHFKSNIKTTSISPGLVATYMGGQVAERRAAPALQPEDIADAVIYALSTPPSVNITELTIQPVSGLKL